MKGRLVHQPGLRQGCGLFSRSVMVILMVEHLHDMAPLREVLEEDARASQGVTI